MAFFFNFNIKNFYFYCFLGWMLHKTKNDKKKKKKKQFYSKIQFY